MECWVIEKPCNRWPGHSRCVKAVKRKGCSAVIKNYHGRHYLVCQSSKARKGEMPARLILLKTCCEQEVGFIQKEGVLRCLRCNTDYCPICKGKIDQDGTSCVCAKNGGAGYEM